MQVNTGKTPEDYYTLKRETKTNLVEIPNGAESYLQIIITMPKNKVITNVEVYAMYFENFSNLYVSTYDAGQFISKIYDTGFNANYYPLQIEGTVKNLNAMKFFIRGLREGNDNTSVFTDWYQFKLDSNLLVIGSPHVFNDYRLFQFRIDFESQDAEIQIEKFILERI